MTFINKQGETALWPRHHALKACRKVDVGLQTFYNTALDGGDRAALGYRHITLGSIDTSTVDK